MQSRAIILATSISIIFLNTITEVVTSLPPEVTSSKNNTVKRYSKIRKSHPSDVTVKKLDILVDYFWLEVAIIISCILCTALTCYCWCTLFSSGRRVANIIGTYWNCFIRLFYFRGRRGEYVPARHEQQEMVEVAQ